MDVAICMLHLAACSTWLHGTCVCWVQAATLWALLSGGSSAQEQYMAAGRHVVDVLWDFSAAKLTATQVREQPGAENTASDLIRMF